MGDLIYVNMPPKATSRRNPSRRVPEAESSAQGQDVPISEEPCKVGSVGSQPQATPRIQAFSLQNPTTAMNPPVRPPSSTSTAGSPPHHRVQRLASLHSRNPSNSSSASTIPGEVRPASLKFQPKAFTRRSKEEREALERAEAERRRARNAAENVEGPVTRGRGGFSRVGPSRGNHRGFRERAGQGQATGVLGSSTLPDPDERKRKSARGGGLLSTASRSAISERPKTTSRVKKEPAVKAEKDGGGNTATGSTSKENQQKVKSEDGGAAYLSSDDDTEAGEIPRVNIEHIDLVSDEEEDEEPPTGLDGGRSRRRAQGMKASSGTLKPVRIGRKEHIERAVGVNTDASSVTSAELRRRAKERGEAEGSLFLPQDDEIEPVRPGRPKKVRPRDLEFVRDERRWKGVYQSDEDDENVIQIKEEPVDPEDSMAIDSIDVLRDAIRSSTTKNTEKPSQAPEPKVVPSAKEESTSVPLNGKVRRLLRCRKANEYEKHREAAMLVQKFWDLEEAGKDAEDSVSPLPERFTGYHDDDNQEDEHRKHITEVFYDLTPANGESKDWTRLALAIRKNESQCATLAQDLVLLCKDLGVMDKLSATQTVKGLDADGNMDMTDADRKPEHKSDDAVYLFQLPPILPRLINPIKKEILDSLDIASVPDTPIKPPKSALSSTKSGAHIKTDAEEVDIVMKTDPDELPPGETIHNAIMAHEKDVGMGKIGTLTADKNRRIIASWGGRNMELKKGPESTMLQELMLIDYHRTDQKSGDVMDIDGREGKAVAVGNLGASFVLTPDWSDLLGG